MGILGLGVKFDWLLFQWLWILATPKEFPHKESSLEKRILMENTKVKVTKSNGETKVYSNIKQFKAERIINKPPSNKIEYPTSFKKIELVADTFSMLRKKRIDARMGIKVGWAGLDIVIFRNREPFTIVSVVRNRLERRSIAKKLDDFGLPLFFIRHIGDAKKLCEKISSKF